MFTGISGSYTSQIAAMIASSVGFAVVSPSGVQAVYGCVTSFTARLLASIQGSNQSMPGQRRALHARWIFVHAGQRLQAPQRIRQRAVALRTFASPRHLAKRLEQGMRICLAASDDRFGHQVSGGNADRAAARLKAGIGD